MIPRKNYPQLELNRENYGKIRVLKSSFYESRRKNVSNKKSTLLVYYI